MNWKLRVYPFSLHILSTVSVKNELKGRGRYCNYQAEIIKLCQSVSVKNELKVIYVHLENLQFRPGISEEWIESWEIC